MHLLSISVVETQFSFTLLEVPSWDRQGLLVINYHFIRPAFLGRAG